MPETAAVAEHLPSHAEVNTGAMLRLDDEMAGLIEAADTPADHAGAHPTKPEPASSVAGNVTLAQSKSADALDVGCAAAQLAYCSAVLCCALLCCALCCSALLRCALLSGAYELALHCSMGEPCLFYPT